MPVQNISLHLSSAVIPHWTTGDVEDSLKCSRPCHVTKLRLRVAWGIENGIFIKLTILHFATSQLWNCVQLLTAMLQWSSGQILFLIMLTETRASRAEKIFQCIWKIFVSAGLFDTESGAQEAAFMRAVTAVNDDRSILTRSLVSAERQRWGSIRHVSDVWRCCCRRYPSDDSFKASKSLCDLILPGVAGVFGPVTPATADLVEALSSTFHVPFMQYNFEYIKSRSDFSINVHPHPRLLGTDQIIPLKRFIYLLTLLAKILDLEIIFLIRFSRESFCRFRKRRWLEIIYSFVRNRGWTCQNSRTFKTSPNICGHQDNPPPADARHRRLQTPAQGDKEVWRNPNRAGLRLW